MDTPEPQRQSGQSCPYRRAANHLTVAGTVCDSHALPYYPDANTRHRNAQRTSNGNDFSGWRQRRRKIFRSADSRPDEGKSVRSRWHNALRTKLRKQLFLTEGRPASLPFYSENTMSRDGRIATINIRQAGSCICTLCLCRCMAELPSRDRSGRTDRLASDLSCDISV